MSANKASAGLKTITGPSLGSGPDQIGLLLGEDAYAGDVQFTVSVNGKQVGGVQSVTAIQANGQAELFTLNGDWGPDSVVGVNFLNDGWDGTSTANGHDRNLYVDDLTYNGVSALGSVRAANWSGPTYIPVSSTVRASDFVGSLGVTTHVYYFDTSYVNLPRVMSELGYLGFSHVRDGGSTADPGTLSRFETMAAAGIKFDFASAPSAGWQVATANVEKMLAEYPGSIVSVEGINEVAASFSYGGLKGEDAGNLYQHDLYQAIRADPKLAGVSVVNYTNLNVYDPTTYTRYGDISGNADYGNVHLYGYGGMSNYLSTLLPRMLEGTPNSKGFVVTETGYDTMSNGDDVSAKYLLDDVFDLKQAGASMSYIYELMDDNPDPGMTNTEDHFGLFNADGTPKEAATAFHNLTTILADGGANAATFTPGTLAYTVSGLPASGNSMLLAKSDGRFDLAVWAEPLILAGDGTATEVAAPVSTVTVKLGTAAATVSVFDPLVGSTPVQVFANATYVTLQVTDHPLIVDIDPVDPGVVAGPALNVTLFDRGYYLAHNPDVAAAGVDPYQHYMQSGWKEGRNPSASFDTNSYLAAHPEVKAAGTNPLLAFEAVNKAEDAVTFGVPGTAADPMVDASYYYAHQPDVARAGVDAGQHYAQFGWHEGRNPDAWFDTSYYLQQNPDVKAAGVDPLTHFETYGWKEGRAPSLLFDDAKYLAANPDVKAAGVNPLQHYMQFGANEGRMSYLTGDSAAADPLVNAAYYDAQLGATLIPTGTAGAQQAAASYAESGGQKGLNPDAFFDTRYYMAENPGVDFSKVNPLTHFETVGWKQGLDPSAAFSTHKYLAANPDVKAAGMDPLLHYVAFGQAEGRAAIAA